MTEKLYYADPGMLEFDAAVVRAAALPGGGCEVVLDRTCFYPGGGGQPADKGTLGGAAVVEVRETDDGDVVHVLERPIPGGRASGAVDAARRLDFMAQHTGEHILAQALLQAGGLHTVSVHFGDDDTTIEVKADSIDDAVLAEAERISNRVIRENRRVLVHQVDRSEASRFALRRAPPAEETRLRIVEVEGFDLVGCSGVHARSTGEVFLIKAVSQEKIRGRVRLHVLIGERAFADYGRKVALSQALSRALTCGEDAILARVQDLQAAQLEAAREMKRVTVERAGAEAESAVAAAPRAGAAVLVTRIFDGAGADYLKAFVERVTGKPGRACIALDRGTDSFQWIVAHSMERGPELAAIVSPRMAEAGAKGGGRGARMQGVGARRDAAGPFAQGVEKDLARALGGEAPATEGT
ncbi:MAG TPA: alanyl-tRNA editing protein [Spirochaetia bacterium]|nr:alanyl-tRNA editing protein [Spirochaetia bacterium]